MRRRDDLMIGPREKAIEAIEAGKKEEAIRYIGELVEEFRPLHDRYAEWIQSLLVFIAERVGEEAVEEALVKTFDDVYRGKLLSLKNMSHEDVVKSRSKSHRSLFSQFYPELGMDFMKYEFHRQFDDQGRPTGQPCRWIIYKRKKT